MPKKPDVDPEDMYVMWLASNRNGRIASEKLGMNHDTFLYHARQRNFESRYMADFSEAGKITMRIAIADGMQKMPRMMEFLYDIAENGAKDSDRLVAIRTYRSFLPEVLPMTEETTMSFIEARAVQVTDGASPVLSIEEMVREGLENNIIEASDRSRRR